MTPLHYRVLREASGLGTTEVAQALGVTDRSARRWEATHPPPDQAVELVTQAWHKVRDAARVLLDSIPDDPEQVILSRHTAETWTARPGWAPGMDAAVTRLVYCELELDGVAVTVIPAAAGAPSGIYTTEGVLPGG